MFLSCRVFECQLNPHTCPLTFQQPQSQPNPLLSNQQQQQQPHQSLPWTAGPPQPQQFGFSAQQSQSFEYIAQPQQQHFNYEAQQSFGYSAQGGGEMMQNPLVASSSSAAAAPGDQGER